MVSAFVLLPVALFCVWAGGYAFMLLVSVACLLLSHEWLGMCGFPTSDPASFWFPITMVSVAIAAGLGAAGSGLVVVLLGTVAVVCFYPRLRRPPRVSADGPSRPGQGGHGLSGQNVVRGEANADSIPVPTHPTFNLAFGIAYLGFAAVAVPWLRADPEAGFANTLFMLSIVWASDVGAYMVGRMVGGPKLAPGISPGKTWSGAAGGLVSGGVGGLAVAACLSSGISPLHVIGLGFGLGIVSQAGDLLESALKRHFGVKDSGRIIPGHGGLLDRLDALLAVAPIAALLALTVGRGVVLWR
jgi:phosphatidate cytidylyltransferase